MNIWKDSKNIMSLHHVMISVFLPDLCKNFDIGISEYESTA